MEEIETLIHDFILHEFLPGEAPSELKEETRLITGGILDSISTLKLVTFLEDQFGIRIEAYEAGVEHLDTIRSIAGWSWPRRPPPEWLAAPKALI